ncbi:M28 family peptidase [Pendulispora brunnea]|uniref:Carboxypeptidase Q n=1 Tax=Pendulispora brunnea TaxID=2905690 RepID=A0ABZ2KMV5_9BACT
MDTVPSIPHLDRLIDLARKECRAFEHLEKLCELCADEGPRMPCTPGDVAAIAWAKATMLDAGLANVHAETVTAPVWTRGEKEERCMIVEPRTLDLEIAALGGSAGTPAEGIFEEVIAFSSLEALDAAPIDEVKGKIVYLNHPIQYLPDGTGYDAASSEVRISGPSRAANKDAMGLLMRSANLSAAAQAGALTYGRARHIPVAALAVKSFAALDNFLRKGARVRIRLTLSCFNLPPGESANVIGEVVGSDLAEEIVLLGAHLDSWDLGQGAFDGAGCAIAIEVARLIAALPHRPRRTVRTVLFANKEMGTSGGLAYASAHTAEAPRHVVALEADQGGGVPLTLRVPALAGEHALTKALCENIAPLGIALDSGTSRGADDIAPLRQLGVPIVDVLQDTSLYLQLRHTEGDVLEVVERADLETATLAFAVAVWVLANAEGDFRVK